MSELTTTSQELIKAELNIELTKAGLSYQTLLQEGENVIFTRDNLNEKRDALVKLRQVKKVLEGVENPYTERWKMHNAAKKSLIDPVEDLLKRKESEFKKIAFEIDAENKKAEAEKQRVAGIKELINSFFIDQSQNIASAKTSNELADIEKLIGSHKANKTRYQELLPELIEKANLLTPLIKEQKEAIKKLEQLKLQEQKAETNGNDQAVLDAREAQEKIQSKILQTTITVQEKAVKMAESNGGVIVADVVTEAAPKARRSTWEWEVIDIKETFKKMPSFVELTPNKEKIDEYLKAKRTEGLREEEFIFAGVKFYLKKSY